MTLPNKYCLLLSQARKCLNSKSVKHRFKKECKRVNLEKHNSKENLSN